MDDPGGVPTDCGVLPVLGGFNGLDVLELSTLIEHVLY
jgi:hypothetical protein